MTFWSTIKTSNLFFLVIALCAVGHPSWAQPTNISPYSRSGLGDIHDQTNTEQFSMGGLSIPVIDPFALNVANPATYNSLARPLFSVGMRLHLLNMHTSDEMQSNQNHTLNNLAVAFPLARRKWGLTAGVMPFSSIGYNITQRTTSEELNEEVRFDYIGEGGLTKAFLGNAFQLYNREDSLANRTTLSIGANISYIFGNVDRLRKSVFPDESLNYNLRVRDALRVDDFSLDFGVNFSTHLRKMTEDDNSYSKLIFGATFRLPKELNSSGSLLAQTYTFDPVNQVESPIDTVRYSSYDDTGLNMPLAFGVGVALDMVTRNFQKIVVGAEYRTEMWSDFKGSSDETERVFDELGDSQKIIIGADFLPNSRASRRIFSKIHYRLGVRYEQMNVMIDNEQLDAYGISFGAGIPISLKRPQSPSTFNIGIELGQRGTTDNNMLREDYLMISFGLTLMPHFRNAWFVQRKYD